MTTSASTVPLGLSAAPLTALPMMQPVLRRGRSYLDRQLLPGDENEARLTALVASASERGLDGVVIFAAAHMPENLIYYANYTPTTFHGALVASVGKAPTLFAGKGGARDHPYIKSISWVQDLRYAAALGQAIVATADEWGASWRRLGVVGLDTALPHEVRDEVAAALDGRMVGIDDLVIQQRRQKSAREIAVLARAHSIAARAAAAAAEAYDSGAGRRAALAAADFAARSGDAHDCRITVGVDGGVANLSEVADDRGPLHAVIAVESLGYWGMAPIRLDASPHDDGVLDQVTRRLRVGATAADLLEPEAGFADRLLINGIGCGLAEAPNLNTDPSASLMSNEVLTVVRERQGANGSELDVRTVLVTAEGSRALA